jgi:Ca2+/Na+ antiporter
MGLLVSLLIALVQAALTLLPVDTTTMAATLVAFGAEVPDAISSVSLAHAGHFDAAMAGAIGSQVINITIGIGMPIFLMDIFGSGKGVFLKKHASSALILLISLLLIVILGYIIATLPLTAMLSECRLQKVTTMKRNSAMLLLALFITVYASFILLNEHNMHVFDTQEEDHSDHS